MRWCTTRVTAFSPRQFPSCPRISLQKNIKGYGVIFGDYDNDGDLDLFVPRGSWNQEIADVLLRNDGGIFEDVAQEAGLPQVVRTSNAIWLDFDRDGRDDAGRGLASRISSL